MKQNYDSENRMLNETDELMRTFVTSVRMAGRGKEWPRHLAVKDFEVGC